MIYRVGIENNNEGFRSIAWALEHPGCYAYGRDAHEALANLPDAIRAYLAWINQHETSWANDKNIELRVEETFTDYNIDESYDRNEQSDHYTVEPWFQYDWKPLIAPDIERALKLLAWGRVDLMDAITGLSAEKLDMKYDGGRWPINGILRHIGGAEWWYMDNLGLAFPESELPKEPIARLEKVRVLLNEALPKLEGVKQVVGLDGEFWSPRKMLRRTVWHERDHIVHIRKLV